MHEGDLRDVDPTSAKPLAMLVVENVRYDADAHRVSLRIVLEAGEPTESIQETIHVMQFDLSEESMSETLLAAVGTLPRRLPQRGLGRQDPDPRIR